MDCLPEELLRQILVGHLQNDDGSVIPTLSSLGVRFYRACSVNSQWKAILTDEYTPRRVSVAVSFNELEEKLLPIFTEESSDSKASNRNSTFPRVLETLLGRIDLLGSGYTCLDGTAFSAALHTLCQQPNAIQTLSIDAPDCWRSKVAFDCRSIEGLGLLEELRVRNFKDLMGMECLPSGLKVLDIKYGELYQRDVLSSHGCSILDIPPHLKHLKKLCVCKEGTIGVIARQLLQQVQEVTLEAKFLLVAVDTLDESIVSLFKNPFLEGAYVPPHILADWTMIEASHRATDLTCSQLLEKISNSGRLHRLRIKEEANSIKVVPADPYNEREMLQWIASISEHQSQLLFGMNGVELRDRLDLLLAMKRRSGMDVSKLLGVDIHIDDQLVEFTVCGSGEG
jgi:hypothetical protein